MAYTRPFQIEFNHCDPAGIVFYPRYFEMANHIAENFFAEVVGHPYARVVGEGNGTPTVHVEADFRAPSRLGDVLTLSLAVVAVGRSSVDFAIAGSGPEGPRFTVAKRLVWTGPDRRSAPWPDTIRARLVAAREDT